jgi:phosphohistidine phosphatase
METPEGTMPNAPRPGNTVQGGAMKALTIIRHAKSSWQYAGMDDVDRPLNHRGRRDAPRMGRQMARRGLAPDCFLSSPANRAITTARAIAEQIGFPGQGILEIPRLYDADVTDLVEVVRTQQSGHAHVALVAHNPGCTDLLRYLTGQNFDSIPTCAVAHTSLAIDDWQNLRARCATLRFLDVPRSLTG